MVWVLSSQTELFLAPFFILWPPSPWWGCQARWEKIPTFSKIPRWVLPSHKSYIPYRKIYFTIQVVDKCSTAICYATSPSLVLVRAMFIWISCSLVKISGAESATSHLSMNNAKLFNSMCATWQWCTFRFNSETEGLFVSHKEQQS